MTPETKNEVVATLKLAAASVGIAFLLGAMCVVLFLPMWLFVKLTGISP
jgi:hypothetical protein